MTLLVVIACSACGSDHRQEDLALISAARAGHGDTVRSLLATGRARVDAKDEAGNTALIEAARYGHDAVVQTLLAAGANVDAKNDRGETALQLASQGGHDETVIVLEQAKTKR